MMTQSGDGGAGVGGRVQSLRIARAWTREDLAREAGVPAVILAGIEADPGRRIAARTLDRLAAALGCSRAELEGTRDFADPRAGTGERVRGRRMMLGLTQVELAGRIGHKQGTIAKIEASGPAYRVGEGLLAKLARALDCSPADLSGVSPGRPATPPPAVAPDDDLGGRFRTQRMASGISQRELAGRMDVPYQVLSMLERGERRPGVEFLAKAAQAMGCDLESLVPGLMAGAMAGPPVVLVPSAAPGVLVGRTAEDLRALAGLGFRVGVRVADCVRLVEAAAAARSGLAIRFDLPKAPTLPADDGSDGLGPDYRRRVYDWAAGYLQKEVPDGPRGVFMAIAIQGHDRDRVAKDSDLTPGTVKTWYYAARGRYQALIESLAGRKMAARLIEDLADGTPEPPKSEVKAPTKVKGR